MSIQGRLIELTNRHRQLDQQLADELKRPSGDSIRMSSLKREKLKIKEEIKELRPH